MCTGCRFQKNTTFQTVGSIKQVVGTVNYKTAKFNQFTTGVVKAAFPYTYTYIGGAFVKRNAERECLTLKAVGQRLNAER